MPNPIYVSRRGLELLHERLKIANEQLTSIRTEKSKAYTATGDTWHDNPYFNKLEQDERRKAEETAELAALISNAQEFSLSLRSISRVQLGSIVRVRRHYTATGEEDEFLFEVTGYGETNVAEHRIAYNAPMIQVLIGLQLGESAQGKGPKGTVEYDVLEFYSDWNEVDKQK